MRAVHCTWTLILFLALPVSAQQPQTVANSQPAVGYTVFLRGSPVGHQELVISSDAGGLVIAGQGQIAAPIDVITRRAEVRYRPDLSPASLEIDARVGGMDIM